MPAWAFSLPKISCTGAAAEGQAVGAKGFETIIATAHSVHLRTPMEKKIPMRTQLPVAITVLAILLAPAAFPQDQKGSREITPIYRLTVVERTLDAVNYRYRNGPTKIDFRGTVLLPLAKGDAIVESKSGR